MPKQMLCKSSAAIYRDIISYSQVLQTLRVLSDDKSVHSEASAKLVGFNKMACSGNENYLCAFKISSILFSTNEFYKSNLIVL